MNAYDRMSAKLDTASERISAMLDRTLAEVNEQRRYNANTALLVIVLWGVGLPLVVVGSFIFAATRF